MIDVSLKVYPYTHHHMYIASCSFSTHRLFLHYKQQLNADIQFSKVTIAILTVHDQARQLVR